jgi:O-antigen/teichoic acid export membrane protein
MMLSASSSKRKILVNATVSLAGFAVQVVVAFFLSPILVHGLGDRRYGVWLLIESILAYLLLLDFGVAASVVRYVAKFESRQDFDNVNRVFTTSLCIFGVAGAAALLLATAISFVGLRFFEIPAEMAAEARGLLMLLGLNLGLGLPLGVFACVLDALGRYPAKTAVRISGLLVRSGLLLAVVRSGGGLVPLGIVLTSCQILESTILAVAALHYLPKLRFAFGLVDRETFATIRSYTVNAFVAMIAGRISFQSDAIVIGFFLFPEQITFFGIAARLVDYAKDSLRTATAVLTPAFSVLDAHGDHASIRQIFIDSTRYALWLVLPIQTGLIVLGRPFLDLWMGPRIGALSYPVLLILVAPLALATAQAVAARLLYGTSRLGWFSRIVLAEAIANAILSLVLVKPFGIRGVAIGTMIPNIVFNAILIVYICRVLEISPFAYVRLSFGAPLAAAVGLGVVWSAVESWLPSDRWLAFFLTAGIGSLLYAAIAITTEIGPRALLSFLKTRLPPRIAQELSSPAPAVISSPAVRMPPSTPAEGVEARSL